MWERKRETATERGSESQRIKRPGVRGRDVDGDKEASDQVSVIQPGVLWIDRCVAVIDQAPRVGQND